MMLRKRVLAPMISLGVAAFAVWCWPHAATRPVLAHEKRSGNEAAFEKTARPLLHDDCVTCHSTEKQKGELDLERFTTAASVKKQTEVWERSSRPTGHRRDAAEDGPADVGRAAETTDQVDS